MKRLSVVDYGVGNIQSILNAFMCFDVNVSIAARGDQLDDADYVVLPGVGSFDAGMHGLRTRGHDAGLQRIIIEKGVPFLGICLGLQLLFRDSEEGKEKGLGWFDSTITRFPVGKVRVPHVGWNDVSFSQDSRLFAGIVSPADFYFVHSYCAASESLRDEVTCANCTYDVTFAAAIERDNISAVQFHPEKSQSAGIKVLENFLKSR